MTRTAASDRGTSERANLERLRPQFEGLGYRFDAKPDPATLPDFMAGWTPDAVATRGDDNIAVEVKTSWDGQYDRLHALRSRFADQRNWRLAIVAGGADPETMVPLPVPEIEAVRRAEQDVESLIVQGHFSAALVMAFALLEATLRTVSLDRDSTPAPAGAVVQALAIEGLIEPDDAGGLRPLIELRNQVAHGGLDSRVTERDVRTVLMVARKALTAAFAA